MGTLRLIEDKSRRTYGSFDPKTGERIELPATPLSKDEWADLCNCLRAGSEMCWGHAAWEESRLREALEWSDRAFKTSDETESLRRDRRRQRKTDKLVAAKRAEVLDQGYHQLARVYDYVRRLAALNGHDWGKP